MGRPTTPNRKDSGKAQNPHSPEQFVLQHNISADTSPKTPQRKSTKPLSASSTRSYLRDTSTTVTPATSISKSGATGDAEASGCSNLEGSDESLIRDLKPVDPFLDMPPVGPLIGGHNTKPRYSSSQRGPIFNHQDFLSQPVKPVPGFSPSGQSYTRYERKADAPKTVEMSSSSAEASQSKAEKPSALVPIHGQSADIVGESDQTQKKAQSDKILSETETLLKYMPERYNHIKTNQRVPTILQRADIRHNSVPVLHSDSEWGLLAAVMPLTGKPTNYGAFEIVFDRFTRDLAKWSPGIFAQKDLIEAKKSSFVAHPEGALIPLQIVPLIAKTKASGTITMQDLHDEISADVARDALNELGTGYIIKGEELQPELAPTSEDEALSKYINEQPLDDSSNVTNASEKEHFSTAEETKLRRAIRCVLDFLRFNGHVLPDIEWEARNISFDVNIPKFVFRTHPRNPLPSVSEVGKSISFWALKVLLGLLKQALSCSGLEFAWTEIKKLHDSVREQLARIPDNIDMIGEYCTRLMNKTRDFTKQAKQKVIEKGQKACRDVEQLSQLIQPYIAPFVMLSCALVLRGTWCMLRRTILNARVVRESLPEHWMDLVPELHAGVPIRILRRNPIQRISLQDLTDWQRFLILLLNIWILAVLSLIFISDPHYLLVAYSKVIGVWHFLSGVHMSVARVLNLINISVSNFFAARLLAAVKGFKTAVSSVKAFLAKVCEFTLSIPSLFTRCSKWILESTHWMIPCVILLGTLLYTGILKIIQYQFAESIYTWQGVLFDMATKLSDYIPDMIPEFVVRVPKFIVAWALRHVSNMRHDKISYFLLALGLIAIVVALDFFAGKGKVWANVAFLCTKGKLFISTIVSATKDGTMYCSSAIKDGAVRYGHIIKQWTSVFIQRRIQSICGAISEVLTFFVWLLSSVIRSPLQIKQFLERSSLDFKIWLNNRLGAYRTESIPQNTPVIKKHSISILEVLSNLVQDIIAYLWICSIKNIYLIGCNLSELKKFVLFRVSRVVRIVGRWIYWVSVVAAGVWFALYICGWCVGCLDGNCGGEQSDRPRGLLGLAWGLEQSFERIARQQSSSLRQSLAQIGQIFARHIKQQESMEDLRGQRDELLLKGMEQIKRFIEEEKATRKSFSLYQLFGY